MQHHPFFEKPLTLFMKGICMGTADIIPGVSGGTIALILGIYSRFIDSLKSITPRRVLLFFKRLFSFRSHSYRHDLLVAAGDLNLNFLIPLFCGIATAFLIASRIIPWFLTHYPAPMNSLFMGLIFSSSYIPFSHIPNRAVKHFCLIFLFAILAYLLVGLPILKTPGTLPFLFACGAIAICAMVLPGISGSYMLQVFGQYQYMLEQLHRAFSLEPNALLTCAVFIGGIIFGLSIFVRILSWALHHHKGTTMAALTGLMIGSLSAVWPFKNSATLENLFPTTFGPMEFICSILFVVGIVITFLLIWIDSYLSREKE